MKTGDAGFPPAIGTSRLWQGSRCARYRLKVYPPIIESDRVVLSR
jgi:hypothetical protein